jgi:hypothetical protein
MTDSIITSNLVAAREAFALQHEREPRIGSDRDEGWIAGYVASLDEQPHDEHCDVNDPIIKGKPCNCRNRSAVETSRDESKLVDSLVRRFG